MINIRKEGREGRKEGESERKKRGERERVEETEIKDHDYSVSENVIEK